MKTDFEKQVEMSEASREVDRRAQALVKGGKAATYSEAMQQVIKTDPGLFLRYHGDGPVARVERPRRGETFRLNVAQQTILLREHQKNLAELRTLFPSYTDTQLLQQLVAEDGEGKRVFQSLQGVVYQDDIDHFARVYRMPKE